MPVSRRLQHPSAPQPGDSAGPGVGSRPRPSLCSRRALVLLHSVWGNSNSCPGVCRAPFPARVGNWTLRWLWVPGTWSLVCRVLGSRPGSLTPAPLSPASGLEDHRPAGRGGQGSVTAGPCRTMRSRLRWQQESGG